MDEKDVKGFIKRDEFEALAAPILDRVKGPCLKALQESGLTVDQISAVELVGSGSRVPAIVRTLVEVFGKEPRRTMNASECVARGCALQCAMLSPTFRVRDFEVRAAPSGPSPALASRALRFDDLAAPCTVQRNTSAPLCIVFFTGLFLSCTLLCSAGYRSRHLPLRNRLCSREGGPGLTLVPN